jgi:hypothetical protein
MHQMHIVTPSFNSLLPVIPVLLAFSLAGKDRPCSATQLPPPSEKQIVDTDASQFSAHLKAVN